MDIEEIKAKRETLKIELIKLVEKFEEETGVHVKDAYISHTGTSNTGLSGRRKENLAASVGIELGN